MRVHRLLILATVVACRGQEPRSAKAAAAHVAASPGAASDTARPGYGLPHLGSWTPTTTYVDSVFTIEVPATAVVSPRPVRDGVREIWVEELPGCRWPCYVTISLRTDTASDLLHRAVAEATTAPAGADSNAADDLATVRDSVDLGGTRGVLLETSCGDCTSAAVVTADRHRLAWIDFSLDDRDGNDPKLLRELEKVARTFRWRAPPAS